METTRCIIRPVSTDDIHDLETLYADEHVWTYLGGLRDAAEANSRIKETISNSNDAKHFIVRKKYDDAYIGSIILAAHHNGKDTEISYMFLSSQWGVGYAAESVGVMIDYAFETLDINRLVAETQTLNKPSCKLLARLGFSEDERLYRFGAEQIIFAIYRN